MIIILQLQVWGSQRARGGAEGPGQGVTVGGVREGIHHAGIYQEVTVGVVMAGKE